MDQHDVVTDFSSKASTASSAGEVSRIPFALRRAACECQLRLAGPKQSQDALYALMHFCKTQQQGIENCHTSHEPEKTSKFSLPDVIALSQEVQSLDFLDACHRAISTD